MQVISSKCLSSRKRNRPLIDNKPQVIKNFQQMKFCKFSSETENAIYQLFEYYRVKQANNLFSRLSLHEKHKSFLNIKFKTIRSKETISCPENQTNNSIIFLLSGTLSYKITLNSITHFIPHTSQPGQLIHPLTPPLHYQFDQQNNQRQSRRRSPTLISTSVCLLLIIGVDAPLAINFMEKQSQMQSLLLQKLCQFVQRSENIHEQIYNLLPYFTLCTYTRCQQVSQKPSKFCFLFSGQIQLLKQKQGKSHSIVQLLPYQFFTISQENKQSVACLSSEYAIYMIDINVIKIFDYQEIGKEIENMNLNLEKLHGGMWRKKQMVLDADGLKKKRNKSKNKTRKKCMSAQFARNWNLIDYFSKQMKVKQNRSKSFTKPNQSTVSPKTEIRQSFHTKSIQNLKRKFHKNVPQVSQDNPQVSHAGVLTYVKSPSRSQSTFLSKIPRTLDLPPHLENRVTLVKKTKYKLLRYAKGENLYSVQDYI